MPPTPGVIVSEWTDGVLALLTVGQYLHFDILSLIFDLGWSCLQIERITD